MFGVLNVFEDQIVDYEKITKTLKEELEVDSWDAFLELNQSDVDDITELDSVKKELIDLISFVKGILFFSIKL